MKPLITRLLCLVSVLFLCCQTSRGDESWNRFYDDNTLNEWQGKFQEDIQYNFDNAILPNLTQAEKEKLAGVKLDFPLRGHSPMDFYTYNGVITLPIQSIRFFTDLAMAHAWLDASGYNLSTVYQYLEMLKYQPASKMQGGRFPLPLDALKIPANVRDDARVSADFSQIQTTAIMFLLGHELGHILYDHKQYRDISVEQARDQEAEADRFAIELMRRMRVAPTGAAFWFIVLSRLECSSADSIPGQSCQDHAANSPHPLTTDRLRDLARTMTESAGDFAIKQGDMNDWEKRIRLIALQISQVADTLANKDMQKLFQEEGSMTTPDMLAPRHTATYKPDKSAEKFEDIAYNGSYDGTFTSATIPEGFDIRMILRRKTDKDVIGEYSYAAASGTIRGQVSGNTLYFNWYEGGATGKGEFVTTNGGKSFTGTWGEGESNSNGGRWSGQKQ